MNEPDFEQQLRDLRPAPTRRALELRIASDLALVPAAGTLHRPRISWWNRLLPAVVYSGAGATLAIAAMLFFKASQGESQLAARDVAITLAATAEADVELEHELLDVADAGLVDETDDGLARVVRYESLERRRWIDDDGAITVVEVPREDLVFIPVSFQ